MRIKTNHSRLMSVVLLLGQLLLINKPNDIAEKLVYSLVEKLYKRILVKTITATRAGYTFTLSDQEALALFIFINQVDLLRSAYPYEANELQAISDQIHQEYV